MKYIKELFSKYKYHLLVWLLYIGYEIGITGIFMGYLSSFFNYGVHYTFNIALFYVHSHVVLSYALRREAGLASLLLPIFIVLELLVYVIAVYLTEFFFTFQLEIDLLGDTRFGSAYVGKSVWRSLYFIGFSTGYFFILRYQQRKSELEELKERELQSIIDQKQAANDLITMQNAYLKAQINPHFLLNTLSYFYTETRKTSPAAAEGILSLSAIMQYALGTDTATGLALLGEEITMLENFIYLNKKKQAEEVYIVLEYNEASKEIMFIPLVLMTLLENFLKHAVLDNPLSPARMRIVCDQQYLVITTENLKSQGSTLPSNGIGLKNVKERLKLIYSEQAIFEYGEDANQYFYTRIAVSTALASGQGK